MVAVQCKRRGWQSFAINGRKRPKTIRSSIAASGDAKNGLSAKPAKALIAAG
jgi:hypothetical protein